MRATRDADGSIGLDMERYIEDLTNEVFPGGVHAGYETPSRPELAKWVREAGEAKDRSFADSDIGTQYRHIVMSMLYVATAWTARVRSISLSTR